MAWTPYQFLLAVIMVVTGSINTLSTKWADELEAKGRDNVLRPFHHPFMQACTMFLGEMMCFVAFKFTYFVLKRKGDGSENENSLTKGTRDFNPFILYIPAICDMAGTSIMYVGLNLTFASSFQMFRGSVIVFVGVLSIAFLGRKMVARQWGGIVLVIIGLAIVGAADFLIKGTTDGYDQNGIITGDILIIIAQVITAVQMVVEEKYVAGKDIPALQAVGWEGIFGFVTLALLCIPMYWIKVPEPFSNNSRGALEDVLEGFIQIGNNNLLIVPILGTIISIAFFNFAGISVTKELSATTRMVLDSVRTIVIWAFSLAFFNQKFQWLQLLGFIGLIAGMCLYNGITFSFLWVRMAKCCNKRRYDDINNETIINSSAADTGDTAGP